MIRNALIIISFCATSLFGATVVQSPDGNVSVTAKVKDIGDVNGCPVWNVSYKGKTVLTDSQLGLELKDAGAMTGGFKTVNISRSASDTVWRPVYGERKQIRDNYNEMIVDLVQEKTARKLRLVFRAYNEGAALRYVFPDQPGTKDVVISAERTQFCFAANHTAWPVYSAQGVYKKARISDVKSDCERPLTIEIDQGPAVAIGEAALVDYARMRLKPLKGKTNALESMLAGEVKVSAPYSTPWRVVMLADDVGGLLQNNHIILNLNEPCAIKDTSWIKPGKVIREVTLTTAGGKACVDFAVERGLQYVEYDAGWYGPEYDNNSDATTITLDAKRSKGPLDLHEVIRYAESKGIGILVYVNQRALAKQLDVILPLYKRWGIKGVKYGFVHVGDQKWTTWLHQAIRKAADNQLMVDIHDEYRPTGYSRTYPNLMTMEGIRGNECMPTAEHNLILPFTRYLCGAGDYTICWYSGRVQCTWSHQLAAGVVYYSPLQFLFWYDRPAMYKGEEELDFFKHLPAAWDRTEVTQGKVGEYITVARQTDDQWFVGTMNAVRRRELSVKLDFLEPGKKYLAHIYSDAKPEGGGRTDVNITQKTVDSETIITADLAANGGQAIRIVPVHN